MSSSPRFVRHERRVGPVPTSTKIWQGLGSWPDTFKNFAFNTFLLFYYSQILGMPATLASIAMAIAVVVDAITDPLAGTLSDNLRSPMGRRHPFMYGAALPLGLALWLTFSPPTGLGDTGLFLWLLACTVSVRVSLTFFLVPWNAMFAEFSDDYDERTQIVTWRWAIGWTGGVAFPVLIYWLVFPATAEFEYGQFNPAAYPLFGIVLGVVVASAVFLTTHMTRREARYFYQPTGTEPHNLGKAVKEVMLAFGNPNFLRIFIAVLVGAVVTGTNDALKLFMDTYFWGLRTEDLRWFGIAILGGIAAFVLVPPLQRRFDKKAILITGLVFYVLNGMAFVALRLLDLLPANGDPWLLPILIANVTVRACVGTTVGIIFASMVADLLDDQELRTGRRQEGVFSSALSFSGKATSALGVLLSGLILDFIVGIERGTDIAAADPDAIVRLGVVDGLVMPLISLVSIWLASGYSITRERHTEIRAQLDARAEAARAGAAQSEA